MRGAGWAAFAALLVASPAAAESRSAVVPAGFYAPFERVKAVGAASPATEETVPVPAFRLDVTPVTNGEFLAFVTEHAEWRRSTIKPLLADAHYLRRWTDDLTLVDEAQRNEPVTNVSWFAARAYCRAQGKRLPTTTEWEYALADAGRGQDEVRRISLEWFAKPNAQRLGPVGAGYRNGYGLVDMVGLVWEWTLDYDVFAMSAETRDPNGKDAAAFCGGAAAGVRDPNDYPAFMRFSLRASLKASDTADNLGFRCAGNP